MSVPATRLDPWEQVARLQRVMDDMFGRISDRGRAQIAWVPAVDVSRTEECLVFRFDLPGLSADDVNIEVRDRMLVVAGERTEERERPAGQEGYVSRERAFGAFSRSFGLPQGVDEERISARFANGVLEVRVPLGSSAGPRRIQIDSGQGEEPGRVIEAEGQQQARDESMAASHEVSSSTTAASNPAEGSPIPPTSGEQAR